MSDRDLHIPPDFLEKCSVPERAGDRLAVMEELYSDMIAAGESLNLTAIKSFGDFWSLHVADSLSIGMFFPELMNNECTAADVGCGGGFPILPLAWANPGLDITGIERRGKKADFVRAEAEKIGLSNVSVLNVQAREHDRQYDYVLTRAAGKSWKMVREVRDMVKPLGRIVYYKTPASIREELPLVQREARKYRMSVRMTDTFELPGGGKRCFMVCERTG